MYREYWVLGLAVAGALVLMGCDNGRTASTEEELGSEPAKTVRVPPEETPERWVDGQLTATAAAPLEETVAAAKMALNELAMLNTQATITGGNALVTATTPTGQPIVVDIKRQDGRFTQYGISVGQFGDLDQSRIIHRALTDQILSGRARTNTQLPGATNLPPERLVR